MKKYNNIKTFKEDLLKNKKEFVNAFNKFRDDNLKLVGAGKKALMLTWDNNKVFVSYEDLEEHYLLGKDCKSSTFQSTAVLNEFFEQEEIQDSRTMNLELENLTFEVLINDELHDVIEADTVTITVKEDNKKDYKLPKANPDDFSDLLKNGNIKTVYYHDNELSSMKIKNIEEFQKWRKKATSKELYSLIKELEKINDHFLRLNDNREMTNNAANLIIKPVGQAFRRAKSEFKRRDDYLNFLDHNEGKYF